MNDTHNGRTPRDRGGSQGSLIVYLIIAAVVLLVLGVAASTFFSTSAISGARSNCAKQASYMAEAGMRYAMSQLRSSSDLAVTVAALTAGDFTMDNGDTFALTIPSPTDLGGGILEYTVSCTGMACSGTSAAYSTVAHSFQVIDPGGGTDEEINFDDDIGDEFEDEGESDAGGDPDGPVYVDTETGTVVLGNEMHRGYGCIWYVGSRGPCTDGNCTLGEGVRAYFQIDWTPGSNADGFVFGIVSAESNNASSCGGDVNMGEMLAWGGGGSSGVGLRPPKIGLEYDIYYNQCNNNYCGSGSRCDYNSRDHLAFVYWGSEDNYGWCGDTYDDNRHGAGDGSTTEPVIPYNWNGDGDGYDGYHYRGSGGSSWLEDGGTAQNRTLLTRMEIHRSATPNANGDYCYDMRGWVYMYGDTFDVDELQDVSQDYEAEPHVADSFVLDPAYNTLMDYVRFGWTEATGASTQLARISDFHLAFRSGSTCPGSIPQDYVSAWRMYEGTGVTVHDSNATNANHGTLQRQSGGQPQDAMWVSGVNCPRCQAVRFERDWLERGRLTVPDADSLDLGTAGSIAFWMRLENIDDYAGLVHKGDQSDFNDEAYGVQFWNNRRLWGIVNETTNTYVRVQSNKQFNNGDLGVWHHVVFTWDTVGSNELRLYIDGVWDNTAADGGINPRDTTGDLQIGAQLDEAWLNYTFDGTMDEVYIYDRELTADEVAGIYAAGLYY